MHTLRIQVLMFFICGVQCVSHGMEIIENEYNKNVLEFVAYNLPCDDYHAQRALSSINRKFNKMVEDRYWPQKKFIEKHIQKNEHGLLPLVTGERAWNKDFSKCAWVTYNGDVATPKILQLTLVGKFHSQVLEKFALWKNFYFPVFKDKRPFFDKYGRASLYGYRGAIAYIRSGHSFVQYYLDISSGHSFVQYCLDLNGNESHYCCYFHYDTNSDDVHSSTVRGMHVLLQYPVLAKAFLQSKEVKVTHCCDRCDRAKYFDIKGVTIPDNYKFFKKNVGLEQVEKKFGLCNCRRFTRYDSLEPDLRKALDDQYAKQQAEKKVVEIEHDDERNNF